MPQHKLRDLLDPSVYPGETNKPAKGAAVSQPPRVLPVVVSLLVAALVTVACGFVTGSMNGRWGPNLDTVAAAEKLKQIPAQFGDWRLIASEELDRNTVEILQPTGSLVRVYRNTQTGETVSMTLLLGMPGPIGVHTPEICLPSRAYKPQGMREVCAIGASHDGRDSFWALSFQANDARGNRFRVYYGWSLGDRWDATDSPRFVFAGRPYLYKIQLSAGLPPANVTVNDACKSFLEEFVPVVRPYLVAPASS